MTKKVFLGSDHAGFKLKKHLLSLLPQKFPTIQFIDCGCYSENSCDYPDYAEKVCRKIVGTSYKGILICGSGSGMTIAANKFKGVLAAPVWNEKNANTASAHNNANIICLGARHIDEDLAFKLIVIWLETPFESGRHERRINLIRKLEGQNE